MNTTITNLRKLFHPESLISLCHSECGFCGKDLEEHPSALFAGFDTTKDRRDESRYYFPYLHFLCRSCYTNILAYREGNISNSELLDMGSIPPWSRLWIIVQKPWYPFLHIDLETADHTINWTLVRDVLLVCDHKALSFNVFRRTVGFLNDSHITRFTKAVHEHVDITWWEKNIFGEELVVDAASTISSYLARYDGNVE